MPVDYYTKTQKLPAHKARMNPQDTSQNQPTYTAPTDAKAKKRFIIWLVIWIVALPLATVLEIVIHFVLTAESSTPSLTATSSTSPLVGIGNIISILLGMWFLFGWIPDVIAYRSVIRARKPQ